MHSTEMIRNFYRLILLANVDHAPEQLRTRLRLYFDLIGSKRYVLGSEWTHRLELPPLWERLLYLPANTWLHWEHHTWPSVPLRRFKQAPQRVEAVAEPQRPRADRTKPASTEVQAAK